MTGLFALEPCEAEKAKIHPGILHLKHIAAQAYESPAPMILRLADSSSICFGCLGATVHRKHVHWQEKRSSKRAKFTRAAKEAC